MVSIYLIEVTLEFDVFTTHTFLTKEHAYEGFLQLRNECMKNKDITSIRLIQREINDETGRFNDIVLNKTDFSSHTNSNTKEDV
jgi:hypothetical protein